MTGVVNRVLQKLSHSKCSSLIPSQESHPGYETGSWNYIKLGTWYQNQHFEWNTHSAGNALVFGPPGSGKSHVQYTVIQHCLSYPEQWELRGISITANDLVFYMAGDVSAEHVTTNLEDSVALLRGLKAVMLERYDRINQADGTLHIKDGVKRIMVVIDEVSDLINPVPAEDGVEEILLKEEASQLLSELTGHARAAGINFMAGGVTPLSHMSGEMRNNFFPVISMGDYAPHSDYTPTGPLDSPPELLPPSKVTGRGCITTHLGASIFQAYLAKN